MHSKNQPSCISSELVWASSLMVGHSVQYNAMFCTNQQGEEEFSKILFHTLSHTAELSGEYLVSRVQDSSM